MERWEAAISKIFLGARIQRLREERALTQVELARRLNLSPSYLNQIEKNHRPLTRAVLARLVEALGVEPERFAEEDEARLIADLRAALPDIVPGDPIPLSEVRELAARMPELARAFVQLHKRLREALERSEAMADLLGDDWSTLLAAPPHPYEEVRDFFYASNNHIPALDTAAERIFQSEGFACGAVTDGLSDYLRRRHGIQIEASDDAQASVQHHYDPKCRVLTLSPHLSKRRHAFQMGTELALLECRGDIDRIIQDAGFSSEEARGLARIGLANYFAGALILPYTEFLMSAEAERYDIERLSRQFNVSFETICHRLSTLQRPAAPGVPFFFMRVDRAGNISKWHSATDFHVSRVGGTCPLWNVYEAFSTPGRFLVQVGEMPNGRSYLWVACAVSNGPSGHGAPRKSFALGLGCDIRHAERIVYSKGINLADREAAVRIGVGCKVCERGNCPQRAFPPIGRRIAFNENERPFSPYPFA